MAFVRLCLILLIIANLFCISCWYAPHATRSCTYCFELSCCVLFGVIVSHLINGVLNVRLHYIV